MYFACSHEPGVASSGDNKTGEGEGDEQIFLDLAHVALQMLAAETVIHPTRALHSNDLFSACCFKLKAGGMAGHYRVWANRVRDAPCSMCAQSCGMVRPPETNPLQGRSPPAATMETAAASCSTMSNTSKSNSSYDSTLNCT